ncbi:MAG: hypothetical protein ACE5JL_07160, partial [Dehalococcoidia bacterium]
MLLHSESEYRRLWLGSRSLSRPSKNWCNSRSSGAAGTPGDLAAVLIATVAEKTGYPAETLNLEMELEADLGIDSIK